MEINHFKKKYLEALKEDTAAIFAGAGLSVSCGFVNWKELLRNIADEIELNIDKETDLIAVAQYHRNKYKTRSVLNQAIITEFTKNAEITETLKILSRLPIKNFWTTNYDTLIEEALEKNGKKIDVKITPANLAVNVPKRDAIIYKMHGDISSPEKAVITKDDYETYNIERQLFTTALQGDLISKTFLFIGFSFNDPNLDYILSRIRILLNENRRQHFAFFKNIDKNDFENEEEYKYEIIRQKLKIEDLERYSIYAISVNEYDEIKSILSNIEELYNLNKIFISGSAKEYGAWKEADAINFIYKLTKELIKDDYKIISGFGLGIGMNVINGALSEIYNSKFKNLNEYLEIWPFPQITKNVKEKEKMWEFHRQNMISSSGIVIFMFGNKEVNGKIMNADGVYREFKIARDKKKYIIPIGTTGYMAQAIFIKIKKEIKNYSYLKKYLGCLENETKIEILIKCILQIIKDIKEKNIRGD